MGEAENWVRDGGPDLDQTEGDRAQMPETDQKAQGLPGGHQGAKKRSQQNGLMEAAEESKMELIRDDPEVRAATSAPGLWERRGLRECHSEETRSLRAWDSQVPDLSCQLRTWASRGPFHLGALDAPGPRPLLSQPRPPSP